MKHVIVVSLAALGVATAAFAEPPTVAPMRSAAAGPVIMPDLSLPSPCNLGAMVALASTAGEVVSPQLVDYKCAGAVARQHTASPPRPATRTTKAPTAK